MGLKPRSSVVVKSVAVAVRLASVSLCFAVLGLVYSGSGDASPVGAYAAKVKIALNVLYESGLIKLRVAVKNTSPQPIVLEISDRNPPFMVSILDAGGHDIYQPVYADLAKNRRNRTVNLQLRAHESKTYTLDVAKVRDAKGEWSDLPPGKYQVQVRLARVEYVNGRYKTELFVSNAVAITIPGGSS